MANNNCENQEERCCDGYISNNCPPPPPPVCEEQCTPCDEVTPSQCVIYTGPSIECVGVKPGMPLDTVIALLAAKACEIPEPPEPPVPAACVSESCENLNLCSPEEGCQSPVQYILNETLKMYCNQYPVIEEGCASPVQYLLNLVLQLADTTSTNCNLYPETGEVTSNNKENCKSSLDYAIDLIFDAYDPKVPESFNNILKASLSFFQNGVLISNDNCDVPICCHECCDDGYYILSSMSVALEIFNMLGAPTCCANSYFSAATAIKGEVFAAKTDSELANVRESVFSKALLNAKTIENPLLFGAIPQCCTDQSFYECMQTMGTDLNISSDLLTLGVVETQYANNETLVCKLYEKLKNPALALTPQQQAEFIFTFLENGFITLCCNGQVFIGGALAFGLLLENNSIPCITIPVIFESVGPFCQNYRASLPLISDNGIEGEWTPSTVDTSTVGTFDYTFTPTLPPGLDPVVVQIEILPSLSPTFNPIGDVAPGYLEQGSTAPILPTISTNGITGNWSPAVIDTATLGTFTYTFTPDVDVYEGECVLVTQITIVIYEAGNPPA